jgi:hypothetical protein
MTTWGKAKPREVHFGGPEGHASWFCRVGTRHRS